MSFDVIDAVNARLAAASQCSKNFATKKETNILNKLCVETSIENDAKCHSVAIASLNKPLASINNVSFFNAPTFFNNFAFF